jgi:hypothetical protein
MNNVILIGEPACLADINSLISEWVQQHYGGLGVSLLPEYAWRRRSTLEWTWQGLIGPDRPPITVGLIGRLWRNIKMRFSRTRRLRQRVEPNLGGHEGRRLPVSKAVKRNCRGSLEAQSADSQCGDDDD